MLPPRRRRSPPNPRKTTALNSDDLALARDLADAAQAITLPHFRDPTLAVQSKTSPGAPIDPVTRADKDAEAAMRALIRARRPDNGIVGEESANHQGAPGAPVWILDPIDGTRGFLCGVPLWTTLIALTDNGAPALAIVDAPALGERFEARGADGAWLLRTGKPETRLSPRACSGLAQARMASTTPAMFSGTTQRASRRALALACGLTIYGGDAYLYAMLAMGGLDIVLEAGLAPHDIAAPLALVEAAGGRVTNWHGGSPLGGGETLAVGDAQLLEPALAALASGRG